MVEPPVDFAIIAALKVEREAMVKRLDGVEKVQDEGEPLTYYVGKLSIPGEDCPYTVVVTQLIEMGNPDAAITTTKVMSRWRPRNVLMVGISGGVKEKATLGDVVVSQYAHYYPPAKRKPKEVEHRDRQFTSDLLMYARAQHYEAAEWKGDIGSPRPDTGGETKLPDVKFGPIACGEEVIADHKALAALQRQCPKMVAVAMEGAGVAKAVLSAVNPPRYLEIRGISDYAGPEKNDGWHEYAANAAAAFTIGFLRSRPLPPGPPPEEAPQGEGGAHTGDDRSVVERHFRRRADAGPKPRREARRIGVHAPRLYRPGAKQGLHRPAGRCRAGCIPARKAPRRVGAPCRRAAGVRRPRRHPARGACRTRRYRPARRAAARLP
jgi:nucleoside phosphorylase